MGTQLCKLVRSIGKRSGNKNGKGTETISFIPRNKVPKNKMITYGRLVVYYRPHKSELNRTRLTVGGNLIDYDGNVRTPTADMMTAKILLDSVVSTPIARCLCLDIKDFYFNNPLPSPEYLQLEYAMLSTEIIQQYGLADILHEK